MFIKSRRRLVGLLTAIAVPAVVGALAMPADAVNLNDPILETSCGLVTGNLVANCGFEAPITASETAAHWTHLVDHGSGATNVGGSAAHSGINALSFYSTTGDDVWTQTLAVAPHTKYLVSAYVWVSDTATTPNDSLTIAATNLGTATGGTSIYSTSNTNRPNWTQVGDVVTTGSGHSMTLILSGRNAPAHSLIDDVVVVREPSSSCTAIANNRVENCGFENATADPWVDDTNGVHTGIGSGGAAYTGVASLYLGSLTTDDRWHQVLAVRPHTAYTLSYAVEYWSGSETPVNDLHVSVTNVPAASGGIFKVSTANVPNHFWAKVTKTFTTGNGSTATLTIAGANKPEDTYIDDVSVTAVPHVKITHSGRVVTVTLNGVGGQKVYLEKLVGSHWVITHTWVAPKTGYTKSWALTVGSGGAYRAVAAAAPGYGSASSGAIAIK